MEITKIGIISKFENMQSFVRSVYDSKLLCFCFQILDVVPILARLYFRGKLPISLSYVQTSVLLCVGLQQRNITFIEV